ncbi:glutathione S-transferase family protein [Aspergillus homomorphus CBS 101889]|uniref:Glutathione S-transferase n=1 Tax=Aspergillus homomorphus (strain CBS 101889) TaxID=1450537 RepID=A0A395HM18_ASPHC|nr:glutathione S-transferase [Aspergillus homomorphus CBS 101889]RAL08810.1 glutathione S-transferase [Aspergillus homomorphus CBS 101889]
MESKPYTLYYSPGTASLCVHWMLIDADLPFNAIPVDFTTGAQHADTYRRLNPTGRVPTLIIDGEARGESTALLMLLAERHPDRGLMPAMDASTRPLWLQTMIYLANTVLPAMRDWFYADQDGPAAGAAAVRDLARRRIEGAWDLLDARLAGSAGSHGASLTTAAAKYLVGDTLTTADFMAVMLMRWARDMPRPATSWPHLAPYVDHLTALPSFQEVCRREGLVHWPPSKDR